MVGAGAARGVAGAVAQVMQKGYMVGDEVLRPAKVAVGKSSS